MICNRYTLQPGTLLSSTNNIIWDKNYNYYYNFKLLLLILLYFFTTCTSTTYWLLYRKPDVLTDHDVPLPLFGNVGIQAATSLPPGRSCPSSTGPVPLCLGSHSPVTQSGPGWRSCCTAVCWMTAPLRLVDRSQQTERDGSVNKSETVFNMA